MKSILFVTLFFLGLSASAAVTSQDVEAVKAKIQPFFMDIAIQVEGAKWTFSAYSSICNLQTGLPGRASNVSDPTFEPCLIMSYGQKESLKEAIHEMGGNPKKIDGVWIYVRIDGDIGVGSVSVHN